MAPVALPSSIIDLTARFDSFVLESLPSIADAEGSLLDEYFGSGIAPLVIYGFGDIGRRLFAGFTTLGAKPAAIIDRRLSQTQEVIDGVPCLSVEEGCAQFGGKAVFIVAVFNQSGERSFSTIRAELQRYGAGKVLYFMPVFWRFPDTFLPHYCFDLPSKLIEYRTRLRQVFHSLSDDDSRACYAFHLYQLIAPVPEMTLEATMPDDTYFPRDILPLSTTESFLDGGAYDGITLRRFLSRCGERFSSYLGVEPDPVNFSKLRERVEKIRPTVSGTLDIRPCAIGREYGHISFAASGTISSAANATGELSVPVVPLSEVVQGFNPTTIKLDIEGYELDALSGSVESLQRARPKLAVCVYHRQNHFWELPEFVQDNLSDYSLHLRRHREYLDDFVLYAVPRH